MGPVKHLPIFTQRLFLFSVPRAWISVDAENTPAMATGKDELRKSILCYIRQFYPPFSSYLAIFFDRIPEFQCGLLHCVLH